MTKFDTDPSSLGDDLTAREYLLTIATVGAESPSHPQQRYDHTLSKNTRVRERIQVGARAPQSFPWWAAFEIGGYPHRPNYTYNLARTRGCDGGERDTPKHR